MYYGQSNLRSDLMFFCRQRFQLVALVATLLSTVGGLARAQLTATGTTMGTIAWNVTVSNPYGDQTDQSVFELSQTQLDRVNQLMSTYIADSDVSRFNAYDKDDWFTVDPETVRVVQRALLICEKSEGAFDITVGPLVNVWNFGPAKGTEFKPPTQDRIEKILKNIGYKKLAVRIDPPALRKEDPNIRIDLSAIAKGYAVDMISEALTAAGMTNHMVEVGGEVRTSGHRDSEGVPMKWRIGITEPDEARTSVNSIALLNDQAMASSGDYRQFFKFDGKRYSHVIDPRTGWPTESQVASASVTANDCITADALATAAMVMGFEKAQALCKEFGAQCYIITRNSDGFTSNATDAFPFQVEKEQVSSWWTILIALGIFVAFILAMSVGVIFSNRRIQGSCGGLNNMQDEHGESACGICSNPSSECRELKEAAQKQQAAQEQTAQQQTTQ